MSLNDCLQKMVDSGKLSKRGRDELVEKINTDRERTGTTGHAAEADRAQRVADEALANIQSERRRSIMQALALDAALGKQAEHKKGAFWGAEALLARDVKFGAGHGDNVEARTKVLRGLLYGRAGELILAGRRNILQQQDVGGLIAFVRQLYGENSGHAGAANAARAWGETVEMALNLLEQAGVPVQRKIDWRLPQRWSAAKLRGLGKDGYREAMLQRWSDGRLKIDHDGRPVEAERAVEIIDKAWDRITTNGLSDLEPGRGAAAQGLASRYSDQRAFQWAGADAWLDFNRTFGVGDSALYDLLTGRLDGFARDIAQAEILGPSPASTVKALIDVARKEAAERGSRGFRSPGAAEYRLNALWMHVSGQAASPANELMARGFATLRQWLSASQLGSAVLTATTDFVTVAWTAAYNGLPAARVLGRYLATIAQRGDQKAILRAGLIVETGIRQLGDMARDHIDGNAARLATAVNDTAMRASGMSTHTETLRAVFGMEFQARLADIAGRKVADVAAADPDLGRALARYGIGDRDLELLAQHGIDDVQGATFFVPEKMAISGDREAYQAAIRLQQMVMAESDFAVPAAGAYERSLALGQTRPGTGIGEAARSFLQYKSFPLFMLTGHLARMIEAGRYEGKAAWAVSMMGALTVMGAASYQLKQLAQGKDLRDPNDYKFWLQAFMQGGGAGILGDFLTAATSRSGKGFTEQFFGGPTFGFFDDVAKLAGVNLSVTVEGGDPRFGRDFARFVQTYTPGSTNWYTRLVTERELFNQLQKAIDPEYAQSFSRMQRRQQRENGVGFWWAPGQTTPSRAPGIGQAPQERQIF